MKTQMSKWRTKKYGKIIVQEIRQEVEQAQEILVYQVDQDQCLGSINLLQILGVKCQQIKHHDIYTLIPQLFQKQKFQAIKEYLEINQARQISEQESFYKSQPQSPYLLQNENHISSKGLNNRTILQQIFKSNDLDIFYSQQNTNIYQTYLNINSRIKWNNLQHQINYSFENDDDDLSISCLSFRIKKDMLEHEQKLSIWPTCYKIQF